MPNDQQDQRVAKSITAAPVRQLAENSPEGSCASSSQASQTSARKHIELYLERKSDLVSSGSPGIVGDTDEFIRRVNMRVCARRGVKRKIPARIEDAITPNGTIREGAAVNFFGRWLLIERKQELNGAGRPRDDRRVVQIVATACAEFITRRRNLSAHKKPECAKITRTDISRIWSVLYGEARQIPQSGIDTALRQLDAYLDTLKAAGRDDPLLRQVRDRLRGASKGAPSQSRAEPSRAPGEAEAGTRGRVAGKAAQGGAQGHCGAPALRPLGAMHYTVHPRYSSTTRSEDYRGAGCGAISGAALTYDVEPVQKHGRNGTHSPQARFRNRVALVPRLSIGDFRSTAVIDRLIVLMCTTQPVSAVNLKRHLTKQTDANVYVHDRAIGVNNNDWRATLPPETHQGQQKSFAILIQDATPERVQGVLAAINRAWGIEGDVRPFLIELALDFTPKSDFAPARRQELREQMVAALQRHHWLGRATAERGTDFSARGDARQVYAKDKGQPKTEFLFSRPRGKSKHLADHDLAQPEVRDRIAHGKHAKDLYLDATLYRGSREEGLQVRVEHKIADRRDPDKDTKVDLPEKDRRARVEVEISGLERMDELGLHRVEDLADLDFNDIRKRYLSFWICTAPDDLIKWPQFEEQFRSRGVYGVDLMEQWEAMTACAQGRGSGRASRVGAGYSGAMMKWPDIEKATWRAIDKLQAAWSRFSW